MKMMGILAAMVILSASCTENSRAKAFGGTMTVELPVDTKLDSASWKGEEMWYLTRPMREGEVAETWTMQEDSSFGIVEGTVIFKESKK